MHLRSVMPGRVLNGRSALVSAPLPVQCRRVSTPPVHYSPRTACWPIGGEYMSTHVSIADVLMSMR